MRNIIESIFVARGYGPSELLFGVPPECGDMALVDRFLRSERRKTRKKRSILRGMSDHRLAEEGPVSTARRRK